MMVNAECPQCGGTGFVMRSCVSPIIDCCECGETLALFDDGPSDYDSPELVGYPDALWGIND